MHLLRNWMEGWTRLREAARREFLRDPNVILFDRMADPAAPRRESAGGR